MAFVNGLDLTQARRALSTWLGTVVPGAEQVSVDDLCVPAASGRSSETLMFDASWSLDGIRHRESLVARVQPAGEALFPSYDIAREHRLMRSLGEHTSIAVPRMRWLEPDPSVLGAPFLVMDRIEGRVPPDDPPYAVAGWVLELGAQERARLYDNALACVASVHRVDWQALDLGFLGRPELGDTPLDQQLRYYRDFFTSAAEGQEIPTIEAAFDWLGEHRPTEPEPVVLNWGDCRLGNLLFGQDLSVAGVLDWEMAGLGSPEADLGWWLNLDRLLTEAIGAPRPEGFPERAAVIARFEELSGHAVRNIDFHEVFAAIRSAVLTLRVARLLIGAGALPPDSAMPISNPASNLLARMLGLPEPAAPVTAWYTAAAD